MRAVGYDRPMIETLCFLAGAGFSILVYFRSIRTASVPPGKKVFYFVFTFIGITGTLFLFGVLVAHFLRRASILHQ